MTIAQLRMNIEQMSVSELQTEHDQYQGLVSKGVRDEIMITLLEEELYNRLMFAE